MKKEWLFFCVFFSVYLCPAFSHAPFIACFSFPFVNNSTGAPVNAYPDQLTVAGNSEFLLSQIMAQQNKATLFQRDGCCIINRYKKNAYPGILLMAADNHFKKDINV